MKEPWEMFDDTELRGSGGDCAGDLGFIIILIVGLVVFFFRSTNFPTICNSDDGVF